MLSAGALVPARVACARCRRAARSASESMAAMNPAPASGGSLTWTVSTPDSSHHDWKDGRSCGGGAPALAISALRHCRTVRSTCDAVSCSARSSSEASLSGSAIRVSARTLE
jgi:hypothetical protein